MLCNSVHTSPFQIFKKGCQLPFNLGVTNCLRLSVPIVIHQPQSITLVQAFLWVVEQNGKQSVQPVSWDWISLL